MPPETINVLLVEDNPADARLIRETLTDEPSVGIELVSVDRLSAALARLAKQEVDAILLDLGLPDSQGLETFDRVHAAAQEVPVVVLTGLSDETTAVRAMQKGAQDYLVKGEDAWRSLGRSLRFAIERKRSRRLEETNAEMESFTYSISHDLRAPLRAMQGFAQALLEDYAAHLDATGQDYARRIVDAATRMDGLIQDLLTYSRLSRADIPLGPVSLEGAVKAAVDELEAGLAESKGTVSVESPLPTVLAHTPTLTQVVANLVSNAIKFVAPGTVPRVRIRADDRGERVRLWVEDNGIGIAPENHERIFLPFERLHGREAYAGSGIGLAVVKRGMARMGGACGVESTLGEGSRFWIELAKAEVHP